MRLEAQEDRLKNRAHLTRLRASEVGGDLAAEDLFTPYPSDLP